MKMGLGIAFLPCHDGDRFKNANDFYDRCSKDVSVVERFSKVILEHEPNSDGTCIVKFENGNRDKLTVDQIQSLKYNPMPVGTMVTRKTDNKRGEIVAAPAEPTGEGTEVWKVKLARKNEDLCRSEFDIMEVTAASSASTAAPSQPKPVEDLPVPKKQKIEAAGLQMMGSPEAAAEAAVATLAQSSSGTKAEAMVKRCSHTAKKHFRVQKKVIKLGELYTS